VIPDSLVGLVLFAASLGSGYVYVCVAELRQPRQERSQLVEAAELVFIGAIASSLAALLVAFTAEATGFSDLDVLADDGSTYAVDHPLRLLTQGVDIVAISVKTHADRRARPNALSRWLPRLGRT